MGYSIGDYCYPYAFDTEMQTSSGSKVVSGCHLMTALHSDMYVGGVQLYNPDRFSVGSSLSHTDRPGILFYGIPARQCLHFDDASLTMLNTLGAKCAISTPIGITSGASGTSLWGIYICLILYIKWALRI